MLPPRLAEVTKLIFEVICEHPLDFEHFARTKEALFDELAISLESPYQWLSKINQLVLDEGNPLSSLQNYAKKRIKEFASINFEEVNGMRQKLITSERLACAVIKPV